MTTPDDEHVEDTTCNQVRHDYLSDDNDNDNDDDDDDDSANQFSFSLDEDPLYFYPLTSLTTDDPSTSVSSLSSAIEYDKNHHRFDFLVHLPVPSDPNFFEKCIVLINKCRALVHTSTPEQRTNIGQYLTSILNTLTNSNSWIEFDASFSEDESFFRPFLSNDAWLQCLEDLNQLLLLSEDQERQTINN